MARKFRIIEIKPLAKGYINVVVNVFDDAATSREFEPYELNLSYQISELATTPLTTLTTEVNASLLKYIELKSAVGAVFSL